MSKIEPPARPTRWINSLAVVLLVVTIAVVFLSSGREWVLLAAALGLVAAWLISALLQLGRRSPVAALAVTAVLTLVSAAGAAWALWVRSDSDGPSLGAAPPRTFAVRYLASGEFDGTTIVLTETVEFDGTMSILGSTSEHPDPRDWSMGPAAGGVPSLVRTRTIRPSDATLISSTFTFPLDLGEFPASGGSATLVPSDGSQVVLIAPTGAFGATTPASSAIEPSRDATEETTIPVNDDVTGLSLAVLAEPWRNPAGHMYFHSVNWGPLPWLIGAMVALVGSVLWDRILRLLRLAGLRRLSRSGRRRRWPRRAAWLERY